jgi:hypothetical protein
MSEFTRMNQDDSDGRNTLTDQDTASHENRTEQDEVEVRNPPPYNGSNVRSQDSSAATRDRGGERILSLCSWKNMPRHLIVHYFEDACVIQREPCRLQRPWKYGRPENALFKWLNEGGMEVLVFGSIVLVLMMDAAMMRRSVHRLLEIGDVVEEVRWDEIDGGQVSKM